MGMRKTMMRMKLMRARKKLMRKTMMRMKLMRTRKKLMRIRATMLKTCHDVGTMTCEFGIAKNSLEKGDCKKKCAKKRPRATPLPVTLTCDFSSFPKREKKPQAARCPGGKIQEKCLKMEQ